MSNIINELELSVRTSNVLKNMGDVHTLDDFLALTEGHVRAVRGAGRRVWQEIRSVQTDMRRQMDLQRQMREAEGRSAEEIDKTVLRDWFAGKALAGLLAESLHGGRSRATPNTTAHNCYQYADAMLAARKTKEDD